MSAVELLENMGANASTNKFGAAEQFWSSFGYEKERFQGRKLWCIIHPDEPDEKDNDDRDSEEATTLVS